MNSCKVCGQELFGADYIIYRGMCRMCFLDYVKEKSKNES